MSFLAAIPIIGELLQKITGVVSEVVTDKDKANELTEKMNGVLVDFLGKYQDYVIRSEGEFKDLIGLGVLGKVLICFRTGWRMLLQWGLTLDIMHKLVILGVAWTELETEIIFTLGLAGLRTLEKRLPFPRK